MGSTPEDDAPATRTVIARPEGITRAADDRAHYLVEIEGAEPGRRIEVVADPVVIGRADPAGIVVADALVSRSHCRVHLVMGEVCVTDLGSSNGTFVGERRITGRYLLAPGERVTLGTHVFEHEWRSRREVESARDLDSAVEKA